MISAKRHGKNVSVHGLSGVDNDQSMREHAVDREILVQGCREDFLDIHFQAIRNPKKELQQL